MRRTEGHVRIIGDEVVGVTTKFDEGREVLQLKNDQTYVQDFSSKRNKFIILDGGKSRTISGGSAIVLISCVVSEDDNAPTSQRIGDRILNVHRRSGRLDLAVNEPADWYFVRVR